MLPGAGSRFLHIQTYCSLLYVKGVQKSWGAKGLARFPGYGMAGMNAPIGGLAEEPVWPSGQAGEV